MRRATHPADADQREGAFAEIYRRHQRSVLAVCAHYLADDPSAAEDAAADTFEDLIKTLRKGKDPLREPDKLGAWLRTCARRRCYKIVRRRHRSAPLPDEPPDPGDQDRASQARLAEVNRILDTVVASFTVRDQQIFELYTRQGIRGKRLATVLGRSAGGASKAGANVRRQALAGFGAYVLAVEGRPYCPKLAKILDRYAWNGSNFTDRLRKRIVRHLGNCAICDDCATCNERAKTVKARYAPVLIPVIIAPGVSERVRDAIHKDKHGRRAKTPPPPGTPSPPPGTKRKKHPEPAATAKSPWGPGGGIVAFLFLWRLITALNADQTAATDSGQPADVPILSAYTADTRLAIWSSPAGISCGQSSSVCSSSFASGTQVTLTANVPPELAPARWMGCDNGTSDASQPCTLSLTYDRAVCILPVIAGLDAVDYCSQAIGG